jgi:hypothetical protein
MIVMVLCSEEVKELMKKYIGSGDIEPGAKPVDI